MMELLITKAFGAMDALKEEEYNILRTEINLMGNSLKICSMGEVFIPRNLIIRKFMVFGKITNLSSSTRQYKSKSSMNLEIK